jgi:peptide/nickel transport system ATP-binding protein
MIFQDSRTSLDPRWPIWRSVAEALDGRQGHPDTYESAIGELQRVELDEEFALKRPGDLSGGQRQRAAIARALASRARLIVCDEAVAALDVSVRAGVLNLLLDIRREFGTALVFISHDMSVVAHLSDRVAVMHTGKIEEIGETAQVIREPRAEYTRRLIAAVPAFERADRA